MRLLFVSPLLVLTLFLATAASAQTTPQKPAIGWTVSHGLYDFVDGQRTLELGVEYRFSTSRLWGLDLAPVVGISATVKESFWVYAGLCYDLRLSERWTATPQLAAVIYEDGNGKDLGGPVQFRSGLEVSYRLRRGGRLGVLFYHLSHSRLYELNPGSESLVLTWSPGG
jgi:hypothetical protein